MVEENFYYIHGKSIVELLPVNSYPQGVSPDRCFHMVGNVYEYAVPIISIYGDSTKVGLYSHPDYDKFYNDDYSAYVFRLNMNVKGVSPVMRFSRYFAYGLRICKTF